ncbi:hypothetical protein PM082_018119 [Marasmius tenuissimus]|nr:hypothetical protein PM082_018119 [Marasmius tenuissimus]
MELEGISNQILIRIPTLSHIGLGLLVNLTSYRLSLHSESIAHYESRLTSLNNLSFGVAQIGGISDEYISLLRQKPTGGFSLIPKLESLSLFPVQNFPFTYTPETLIDVFEARWRVLPERDAGLNTLGMSHSRLHFVKLDNPIDDERLDQLGIEGLQVEVWGEN